MKIFYPIKLLGKKTIVFINELGEMTCFLFSSLYYMLFPPYLFSRVVKQIHFIGVKTIMVIGLTGLFSGMVLSLQSYYVLVNFGAESALGSILALSLIRELAPVITALMVIARAGSALTSKIGVMSISDQISALEAMALNSKKYLVVPNLIAGIISLPILTSFFIVIGIWGGYLVGVTLTGLSSGTFFSSIAEAVGYKDVMLSLYKSLAFGLLISWISCYKGFYTVRKSGFGAEGVSRATTESVVLSSVLVLIFNYYITSITILN